MKNFTQCCPSPVVIVYIVLLFALPLFFFPLLSLSCSCFYKVILLELTRLPWTYKINLHFYKKNSYSLCIQKLDTQQQWHTIHKQVFKFHTKLHQILNLDIIYNILLTKKKKRNTLVYI